MRAAYEHCEALVRQADKNRYLASLFAPADRRKHLFALYAFNVEVARIRCLVSDPFPGEMRYQWWRDALAGKGHGDVRAHPVAHALIDTLEKCQLSVEPFEFFIEASTFDLYDDPMHSIADLERYAQETTAALMLLASAILNDDHRPTATDVTGHAGIAYAVCGILRAFPIHTRRGQVYVPADILRKHGVCRDTIVSYHETPALLEALRELRNHIRDHLGEVRDRIKAIDRSAIPAFLPVCLVAPYLDIMDCENYRPFDSNVEIAQWRRQWTLWRAAKKAVKRPRRPA